MTAVAAESATTPRWFMPLLGWRVLTALALAAVTIGSITGRGLTLNGPPQLALVVSLASATVAAGLAVLWTRNRQHRGRLTGFVLDFLITVIVGFIAFNRMDMFTGLDVVGEEFNGSAIWLVLIVFGWLVSGFADRAGSTAAALRTAARYTMIVGAAVMLLTMNLIPGIIEFLSRTVRAEVIAFTIATLVAGYFARTLWGDGAALVFGTNQTQAETLEGLLFVAPNALGFLAFFAGPLVVSLFISFTEWDGLTDAVFVGVQNYADLFSDDLFLRSLRNILIFAVIAIPAAVIPALLLAALLNSKLPGMRIFRAVYFLPSIAGVVGVTLIWKQLFNSTVGFINYTILQLTDFVNGIFGTSFAAGQPQWISDANIALFSVIILFAWQTIGFNTVLFLAGMQGIDGGLYEAADIDGANAWVRFRSITVPLLRPTTVFVVATTTILALQLFNEPFILQSPNPPSGPGNATLTPVVYLYQNAFQQFQIGYASAVAWALFILIFAVTLVYFRRQGEDGVLTA